MAQIFDLLKSMEGQALVNGASNQLGLDKKQTSSALGSMLPLFLGAMKNNASSKSGAEGLLNALQDNRHDGSILNNLGSILGGNSIDDDVVRDGEGILNHVFQGKQQNVATAVSKSSGIDLGKATQLLKVAAPFIMGFLGKKMQSTGIKDANGLEGLLGGMLGKNSNQNSSLVKQILDADGDGSVMDDLAGMLLKSDGNKGGIGGLLGGMLGGGR